MANKSQGGKTGPDPWRRSSVGPVHNHGRSESRCCHLNTSIQFNMSDGFDIICTLIICYRHTYTKQKRGCMELSSGCCDWYMRV